MKVSVIDNEFVATMDRELRKGFDSGGSAKCATAFLTEASVQFLDTVLSDVRKRKRDLHIQLVVGLYLRFTSPNVLRRLLILQRRYGKQLEIKVARNERFHWKLYLFKSHDGRTTCYIGSSNLTIDGLEKNGELNVKLSDDRHAFDQLNGTFDEMWNKHTVEVQPVLSRYRNLKRPPHRLLSGGDSRLNKILESAKRTTHTTGVPQKHKVVFTYFTDFMSSDAERVVRQKTNWDERGWDYMVFEERSYRDWMYAHNSLVINKIQPHRRTVSFCEVETRKDIPTEDGEFFMAYKQVEGSISRTVTPELTARLKLDGGIKRAGDLKREHKLTRKQEAVFRHLLRAEN